MLVKSSIIQDGFLQASFRFSQPHRILITLKIRLLESQDRSKKDLDQVLNTVESTIRHSMASAEACMECNWYGLMALVKRCHEEAHQLSGQIMTILQILDEESLVDVSKET